ncbi:alpha/beta hydrolase [Paenisporosarcina sp. NPDC076898]|uniref:alpha/beta hydrolase n=1 Tax=unclassified Paenisporosarcina TaxID=2642018 RepID=UPI003D0204E4
MNQQSVITEEFTRIPFIEKEVEINGVAKIFGTITVPSTPNENEKFPAVLFISGSGPLDRNGNGPKGKYKFNLYKELAEFIGGMGFVTFRYDKRGTGSSKETLLVSGLWDFVADAECSYTYLQQHSNVDPERIIVLGHSEGTIIGTALSERQKLGGLMLLAGGVANLDEYLKHQRKLAYQELKNSKGIKGLLMRMLVIEEKEEKKVEKLMQKMGESNRDVYKAMFLFKQPAKWLREHYSYDPRKALRQVTCPVLAIQGDKDPLVDNIHLNELSSLVQGTSDIHIIKDMEHGLRIQKEDKSILKVKKLNKSIQSRPLSPDGLNAISHWLISNYK